MSATLSSPSQTITALTRVGLLVDPFAMMRLAADLKFV